MWKYLVLLVALAGLVTVTFGSRKHNLIDPGHDLVRKYCLASLDPKHNITITNWETFIKLFKEVLERHEQPDKYELRCVTEEENKKVSRCIQEKESILDLENLINVDPIERCTQSHQNAIAEYHNKHIKGHSLYSGIKRSASNGLKTVWSQFSKKHKVMAREMFRAYVLQVSEHCQYNLIHKLKRANEFFTDEDFINVMPWLEQANKSTPDEESDEIPEVDIEPDFELAKGGYHVSATTRLIDIFDIETFENIKHDTKFVISKSMKDYVARIRNGCAKFAPYLDATVRPIFRQSKLGYAVDLKDLLRDEFSKDVSARRWLTVTQICLIFESLDIRAESEETGLEVRTIEPEKQSSSESSEPDDLVAETVETIGDIEASKKIHSESCRDFPDKLTTYSSSLQQITKPKWYSRIFSVIKLLFSSEMHKKGREVVMFFRGKKGSNRLKASEFLTALEQRIHGQSENTCGVDKFSKWYTALGVAITVLVYAAVYTPMILTSAGVIHLPVMIHF